MSVWKEVVAGTRKRLAHSQTGDNYNKLATFAINGNISKQKLHHSWQFLSFGFVRSSFQWICLGLKHCFNCIFIIETIHLPFIFTSIFFIHRVHYTVSIKQLNLDQGHLVLLKSLLCLLWTGSKCQNELIECKNDYTQLHLLNTKLVKYNTLNICIQQHLLVLNPT